jgi:SET domain-containing protein
MYKISETKECGRGLFSSRIIPKSTIIIEEAPRIMAQNPGPYNTCVWSLTEQALRSNLDLSKYHKNMLLHTWDQKDQESLDLLSKEFETSRILDTYWTLVTNNMIINGGSGFYPLLSLTNHSCFSNCSIQHFPNGNIAIVSKRKIFKGEEITIPYAVFADDNIPTEDRKGYLFSTYGFDCKCGKCEKK